MEGRKEGEEWEETAEIMSFPLTKSFLLLSHTIGRGFLTLKPKTGTGEVDVHLRLARAF